MLRDSEAVILTLKEALQGTLDGKAPEVEETNGSAEIEAAKGSYGNNARHRDKMLKK